MSRFETYCAYRYFPQYTTYGVLFRDTVSMNLWNSIKIDRAVSKKTAICILDPFECADSQGINLGWINS
jgi:hypothetical protein